MSDHVLLVTGSRAFGAPAVVNLALYDARRRAAEAGASRLIVRHGDSGNADKAAGRWCRYLLTSQAPAGIPVEADPVRADWDAPCRPGECQPGHRRKRRDGSDYCPAAGDFRNDFMIRKIPVPDRCLSFVAAGLPCRGTLDCSERALWSGVQVRFLCDQGDAESLSHPCPSHSLRSVQERWDDALRRLRV